MVNVHKVGKCWNCVHYLKDERVEPCRNCIWQGLRIGYTDNYHFDGCVSGVDSSSKYKLSNRPVITNVVCDENGIVTEVTLCQNSKGRKYRLVESENGNG